MNLHNAVQRIRAGIAKKRRASPYGTYRAKDRAPNPMWHGKDEYAARHRAKSLGGFVIFDLEEQSYFSDTVLRLRPWERKVKQYCYI